MRSIKIAILLFYHCGWHFLDLLKPRFLFIFNHFNCFNLFIQCPPISHYSAVHAKAFANVSSEIYAFEITNIMLLARRHRFFLLAFWISYFRFLTFLLPGFAISCLLLLYSCFIFVIFSAFVLFLSFSSTFIYFYISF